MFSAIVDFSVIIANLAAILGLSGLMMLNHVFPNALALFDIATVSPWGIDRDTHTIARKLMTPVPRKQRAGPKQEEVLRGFNVAP
jgi:hypothetical protein